MKTGFLRAKLKGHFFVKSMLLKLQKTLPFLRRVSGATGKHRLKSTSAASPRGTAEDADSNRPETAQATCLTDIGTRKIFSSEHDLFRKNVRRFFEQEVVPYHAEWEKQGDVGREVWKKAGANGLLGVNCPAEVGGIGGDWLSSVIVQEEQSYAICSGPGFRLHSDIVIPYLVHFGSKEQINKFIPRMIEGTCIGAIAMTEPGAGSDLQGIRTIAKRDGDDWILNGSKTFITNGYLADLVIVVAITDTNAKSAAHGISLFLVEEGMPGFKKGKKLEKLGLKAQDTAELFFDDVRLPSSALLGEANRGFYYLMQELPQERHIVGITGTAMSEAMFEVTRKYVKERKAFGKTISSLQTIQHKLAEMKTEICVGRAFVDSLIDIHNTRGLDSQMASMAKFWISDLQNRIANQCLQMHGGFGYMWEYPIAKAFVDSRVQQIYAGSNEIMKELIARSIVANK